MLTGTALVMVEHAHRALPVAQQNVKGSFHREAGAFFTRTRLGSCS